MAPLATDRDTPMKFSDRVISGELAAGARLRGGALAMYNGAGYLVAASDSATAGVRVAGISKRDYDNTDGDAGDVLAEIEPGVFGLDMTAGLAAAARANVGHVVYVEDDHTVGLVTDSVNTVVAGILEEYEGGIAWVRVGDRYGAPADGDLAELDTIGTAQLANALADIIPGAPTIAIAAEGGDAIAVSVQLKDAQGNNLAGKQRVSWYLSDAAAEGAVSADPPSGGTAVTTGRALVEHTAEVIGESLTDATGLLVLTLTEAGVDAWYLTVMVGPHTVTSAVIQFA